MAQKWYQKASVQTAIVSGIFLIIGLAIPYLFKVPSLEDKIDKLEKENSDKTAEIQRLETQLTPFKTIALEKYTGPEQEALNKLAHEIEKLKNYVDPLKKPISYAVADVEVIVKSDEQVNTTYMDRGGLLAFVKNRQVLLLVSDTKSNARQRGKGEIVYSGNFAIQSNYSQIGKPVEILKESDLIQIEFNKIPENSSVLGGKASVVFNGDLRIDFEIPKQQVNGKIITIKNVQNNFLTN
jgi:hypothetical protein